MTMTSEAEVERGKLFVPAVAPLYERLAPLAYTLIRVALGLILVSHGFVKLFGTDAVTASRNFVNFGWAYPMAWAYFIGSVEFFGGILLILGLWTRAAALAVVVQMAVICFAVLWPKWFWGGRGMEFALLMGIVALAIFFRGGGRWSLDNALKKEL
jgi:putative oxidoreductase